MSSAILLYGLSQPEVTRLDSFSFLWAIDTPGYNITFTMLLLWFGFHLQV
jgi:hypothetical protein